MPDQKFRVVNAGGMWLRTEPVVSDATKKALLPKGQLVTKLAETDKPDWWRISTTVGSTNLDGFSNKNLMAADGQSSDLLAKTLAALTRVAPTARENYRKAIREGGPLFEQHGITTPQRMAHFMAQALTETGGFTLLRENMSYSVPRMLEIFGEGKHSARITAMEAPGLKNNDRALSERVYGLGNPHKARELGNTQPGDGFRYRGNGVLQTTGRDAHRRMGAKCGLDFEGNPDLVTLSEHALKPALQEWSDGNLNHFADINDIRTITKRINGGLNGFSERKAFFAKILPLLKNA